MSETIEKTEYLTPSSSDGCGKFYYDPIDNLVKKDNLKSLFNFAIEQEEMFSYLFSDNLDIPDSTRFYTRSNNCFTLGQIKSFHFPEWFMKNIYCWVSYYSGLYGYRLIPLHIKVSMRDFILNQIDTINMYNNNAYNNKLMPNNGSYFLNNIDKNNREYSNFIKILDRLYLRNNKIGFSDYEIKFSYRTTSKFSSIEELPVFLDSEGNCHVIRPIENESLPEGNGIYIHKLTPTSKNNKNYIRLDLPDDIETIVKAPMINGIFINSYENFKEIYKENYKSIYTDDNKNDDNTIFNIKKLVGNLLYNNSNLTSYGLVSQIIGISLTTEKYYTYDTNSGISEIINITPKLLGEENFNNVIMSNGISRDSLIKNDFILRKTNICSGSTMVASNNIKTEKIKINKYPLNQLKNSILDNDLLLFNETGMALFLTREAAERCMNYGKGDFESYVNYINNKLKNKGVKQNFLEKLFDSILNAITSSFSSIIGIIIKLFKK